MQRWFEGILGVPAAEQRDAAMALLYVFFAASACVVGRTVADTLFLSRVGSDQLASMYLVSALVVGATAMVYGRLARGVSLRRLVAVTHLSLAAGALILRGFLLYFQGVSVIGPIYLLSEIQGAMSAILFATVLNETFGGASTRGVFGVAGIGSTLAGIVFGAVLVAEVDDLHVANLLYAIAILQILALVWFATLPRGRATARTDQPPRIGRRSRLTPLPVGVAEGAAAGDDGTSRGGGSDARPAEEFESGAYRGWLVALALVQFLAIMLVGYQWKIAVNDTYHLSEDAMAAYFGGYYAIANSVTLVLQVAFAGRLLKRRDPLSALWMFPVALLMSAGAILFASAGRVVLWAGTLSKGSEVLRRSFGDPATQLLYHPLPQAMRRRVIAMIGGGVKPVAEAFGALLIVEMTHLTAARDLSYLVAALVVVWIAVAWRCRRLYLTGERSW